MIPVDVDTRRKAMSLISEKNVDNALRQGITLLEREGVIRNSRNGDVLCMKHPVTTIYENPRNRVLFNPSRDANPFFHFMECLWMMGGRNDVFWISQFSSGIAKYSQDGIFHGAYGHRWRRSFDDILGDQPFQIDQLGYIVEKLKKDPQDRRAVLAMWDGSLDLVHAEQLKDVPCNLSAVFSVSTDGDLDMTVFNRSNDIIWGAYGANAVHFSFLQEVMAQRIGVPVGKYWQVSNNYHAYKEVLDRHFDILTAVTPKYYETGKVEPFDIINTDWETWDSDLEMFLDEGDNAMGYKDVFFRKVALPMYKSWCAYKNKDLPSRVELAIAELDNCAATDWKLACTEWLERRIINAK